MLVRAHEGHLRILEVGLGMPRMAPLSDEAAIIGYQCRVLLSVDGEYGLRVVHGRGGQQVELAIAPAGQVDGVAAAFDAVLRGGIPHLEADTPVHDAGRQQLGGVGAALAVEIGVRAERVVRGRLDVVRQLHRRLRGGRERPGGPGEFHAESLHAEGPDLEAQLAAAELRVAHDVLHAVELPGVDDLRREAHHGLLRPETRGLVETNHIFVRILGLFERPQRHIGVLRGGQ